MKNLCKAILGLILIFVYHIPRLIYVALLLSHAVVFNNHPTLTANPAEHVKRARRILKRGRLSELLYVAIELRFALERMTQRELMFAEMASIRMLKEPDSSKKIANLRRLAPAAVYGHEIYLVNKRTGERFKWGEYKPLDRTRVATIQGRLGDLLHPKDGLALGIRSDPWYTSTRRFLEETTEYLSSLCMDNLPFFALEGVDSFEMVKVE